MSRKSDVLNRTWTKPDDDDDDNDEVILEQSSDSSSNKSSTIITADDLFPKTGDAYLLIENRINQFLSLFNYSEYESLIDEVFTYNDIDEDVAACDKNIKNRTIDIDNGETDEFSEAIFTSIVPKSFDMFRNGLNHAKLDENIKLEHSKQKTGIEKRCISENDLSNIKLNDIKTSSPLRRNKLNSDNSEPKSNRTSMNSMKSIKFDEDDFKEKVVFNTTYTSLNTDDAQLEQDIFNQNLNKTKDLNKHENKRCYQNLNSTYEKRKNENANSTIILSKSEDINNVNKDPLLESASASSVSSLTSVGSSTQSSTNNFKQPAQIPKPRGIPRMLKQPSVVLKSSPTSSIQKLNDVVVKNPVNLNTKSASINKPTGIVRPVLNITQNIKQIEIKNNNQLKENKFNTNNNNAFVKNINPVGNVQLNNDKKGFKPTTQFSNLRLPVSTGTGIKPISTFSSGLKKL